MPVIFTGIYWFCHVAARTYMIEISAEQRLSNYFCLRIFRKSLTKISTMKHLKLLLFFAAISSISACKKNPDTSKLSAAFVVSTSRAKDANFSSYSTFFISDTISYVSNTNSNDTIITGAAAATIIGEIKSQMTARGYTFVSRSQNPDLGMRALALKSVNAGVVYPPGWWWGYPGYPGGCYWGCYPPYYPLPPTVYSYTVGDFITETFDVKNEDANNNLQAIWYIQLSGVLSSTDATNVNRTVEGIQQAFVQSPYIQK
jgi:Domain of unknown function (DUF4136)